MIKNGKELQAVLRVGHCLSRSDFGKCFGDNITDSLTTNHLWNKFGQNGIFKFISYLDNENVETFAKYCLAKHHEQIRVSAVEDLAAKVLKERVDFFKVRIHSSRSTYYNGMLDALKKLNIDEVTQVSKEIQKTWNHAGQHLMNLYKDLESRDLLETEARLFNENYAKKDFKMVEREELNLTD